MKNIIRQAHDKQGFANILLIVLVIGLVGVLGYVVVVKKPATEAVPTPASSPNAQVTPGDETANWKTYSGEGFEVLYPADIFAVVPISKAVPPNYGTKHSGNKLISLSRVSKLGKKECSNGQTVNPVVCNADSEGGIEFILINTSAQNLTTTLDSSIKSTVTIAGKEAVKYSIGAEGDGADYYYFPMSSNKTLVIARYYFSEGFLQEALFNQVLSTFKLLSKQNDTAGWKVYRNKTADYEIKYPPNLPDDNSNAPTPFAKYLNIEIKNKPTNFQDLETYVTALAKSEEIEGNKTSAAGIKVSAKKTMVGSEPAYEKKMIGLSAVGNTTVDIYVERGNQLVILSYAFDVYATDPSMTDTFAKEAKKKYETTLKMISTFKLLSVNVSQLTKALVLNGFDQCGNQFKNGEFNYSGGFEAWSKFELENNKLGKSSCAVYEGFVGEKIVFFDLDGDGINEALVPARAVIASSGGELYVFKNVNGVAKVINTIGFGKDNATILSINKDVVVVQIDSAMGKAPQKETYKFVSGKLIKQ